MLITDRHRARFPLAALAAAAVGAGVDAVQLREKDLDPSALEQLGAEVRAAVGGRAPVLINGDPVVAARLGLGVHLPEAGLPPADARAIVGPDVLIGRSVHDAAGAAASAGADYLIAGHVYPTRSKLGRPPLGLDGLREIVAAADRPVLAVGGIVAPRVAEVMALGAHGIAVIGAINDAPDPAAAARALRQALDHREKGSMPDTSELIRLTINGKEVELPPGTTVARFLAARELKERLVVVELNGAILARSAFPTTILNRGDRVEVVHFVGGG